MGRRDILALAGLIALSLPVPVLAQAPQTKPVVTRTATAAPAHPLDPLTADELGAVVRIVRTHPDVPSTALFPEIVLNEPPKAEVLAFKPGTPFRREAAVVVFDRPAGRTLAGVVDLRKQVVAKLTLLPGAQPAITFDELDRVPDLVRAHPAWQDAMRKRGLTDFKAIHVDPWAPGCSIRRPSREPPGGRARFRT